jgi:hypothetical protein
MVLLIILSTTISQLLFNRILVTPVSKKTIWVDHSLLLSSNNPKKHKV